MSTAAFEIYTGKPGAHREQPLELRPSPWTTMNTPKGYLADDGLVDAVNVALLLGQPLLLTGEAGTGKTQLAYSVASELGLDVPLKFETKSTSESKDLFYTYNSLARFQAAQASDADQRGLKYIHYNALGLAILQANDPTAVAEITPEQQRHSSPKRSVVLVDEVDKAPRDFPNDILNEIELMEFRIPEIDNQRVAADQDMKPIVILTSNSEKNLPDAFLRRCIFYHIPFPGSDRLKAIVESRLPHIAELENTFLSDAIEFFERLRSADIGLSKRPATAELLGWILTLTGRSTGEDNPLNASFDELKGALCSLVKTVEDQRPAQSEFQKWLSKRT